MSYACCPDKPCSLASVHAGYGSYARCTWASPLPHTHVFCIASVMLHTPQSSSSSRRRSALSRHGHHWQHHSTVLCPFFPTPCRYAANLPLLPHVRPQPVLRASSKHHAAMLHVQLATPSQRVQCRTWRPSVCRTCGHAVSTCAARDSLSACLHLAPVLYP
jgi:hypothetical protein